MYTLVLTDDEYLQLKDALMQVQDEGPLGEGWKSQELCDLISKIEAAALKNDITPPTEHAVIPRALWDSMHVPGSK